MSPVLVDSSVWIEYFRGSKNIRTVDFENLIDNNNVCINDLILSELIPSLNHRKKNEIIGILKIVKKIPLRIDWDEIIKFQTINLKNGVNNIGIPDLIILQNVIQNGVYLYSIDKHFQILNRHHKFSLF